MEMIRELLIALSILGTFNCLADEAAIRVPAADAQSTWKLTLTKYDKQDTVVIERANAKDGFSLVTIAKPRNNSQLIGALAQAEKLSAQFAKTPPPGEIKKTVWEKKGDYQLDFIIDGNAVHSVTLFTHYPSYSFAGRTLTIGEVTDLRLLLGSLDKHVASLRKMRGP